MHINSLPIELLQDIFTLSTVNSSERVSVETRHPVCAIDFAKHREHLTMPLTLSYVCGRWRSAALALGKLWSTIIIFLRHSNEKELSILSWHLERASAWPLHVTIKATSGLEYNTSESQSWKLIHEHLPRCQSLTFASLSLTIYDRLFPLSGPLPLLSRIQIGFDIWPLLVQDVVPPTGHRPGLFDDPACAPCFDILHLDNPPLDVIEEMPLSSLQQLGFLFINVDYPHLWDLLRECTSLRDLQIPLQFGDSPFPYPQSTLSLPLLKHLFVRDCNLDHLVIAPDLQELICMEYRGELDQSHVPFIHKLVLVFPHEQREPFTITWSPPDWSCKVEELTFGAPPAGLRGTLSALREDEGSEPASGAVFRWLPNLKSLVFDSPGFPSWSSDTQDMEHERIAMDDIAAVLKMRENLHVRIHHNRHMPENQWAGLSARFGGRISTQ
ncbi:hypothetical protein DL93DRAFT_1212256 [Clavulina sp. PMI_390]|nr:hypothetical protein DL93DRAFT_1212256 [Clavulina sp. PMI_390]